jgi:hypothetical protein
MISDNGTKCHIIVRGDQNAKACLERTFRPRKRHVGRSATPSTNRCKGHKYSNKRVGS